MDRKVVPQIQRAIIGAMIQKPGFIAEAVTKLSSEDFDIAGGSRALFDTLRQLHESGAPVNPVTLIHSLGPDYEIAINEALKDAAEDPAYYCEMLRDYTQLSRIQTAALDLACTEDLDKMHKLLDKLNRSAVVKQRYSAVSAESAARDFLNRLASDEKPVYLPWGIQQLDNCITAELGDFIAIGGYPSSGKTLLSLQIATKMAQTYRVGYFSLETSTGKLTDRLISHLSQVPLQLIKRRDLNESDSMTVAHAASQMAKLQLELIQASGMSVQDIKSVSLANRYQIIFVDYMQLVRGIGRSRYEEVTDISMALHELAQSYGITVIALSQLTRPDRSKGKPQPPGLHSFRESGQIEQDLDVALIVYPSNPDDNNSDRIVKVAKNKDGPRARLEMEMHGAVQTLKEIPPDFRDEMARVKKDIRDQERRAAEQAIFTELPPDQTELPF